MEERVLSFKESLKKFLDEQRLDRELKIARKKIAEKEKEKVQLVKVNKNENDKFEEKQEELTKVETEQKKFSLERLKDAGLVAVAVTLISVGYVNFSGKESENVENQIIQTASEYSNNLGDVQLVNSENAGIVENEDLVDNENLVTNEANSSIATSEIQNSATNSNIVSNALETSSSNDLNSYFANLKLNRDNIYSQKLDAYQQIIDSTAISSEQKAIAIQEIEKITETQNSISVAEELIKLKGFDNVVIYVNDNSVTVIVRTANLTSDQVAQIQNIVMKQLSVEASSISISNK